MPIRLRKTRNAVQRRFKRIRQSTRAIVRAPATYKTEVKMREATAVATFGSFSNTGQVFTMAQNIVLGTDNNQRIGRKIVLTGFRIQGTLIGAQINGVADDPYNAIRITCYTVKQGISGIAFGVNDILDAYHFNGLSTVYYDKRILLKVPAKDSTGYIPATRLVDIKIKFRKPITYDAISNVAENEVFLQCVSDSAVAPNPGFVNGRVIGYFEDA